MRLAFVLGLALPAILVFKSIFLHLPAVWGDGPYFHPSALAELFSFPKAWEQRFQNLGGTHPTPWLYPVLFILGVLHHVWGLDSDSLIRIVFYFPSILGAFIFSWLVARAQKLTQRGRFFTSLIYGLNTYFILLIDGGQVGIAMAYGLFPLVFLVLSGGHFWTSLIILTLISMCDPRFAAIAFITWFIHGISIKRFSFSASKTVLLLIAYLGLNSFWLIPSLKLNHNSILQNTSQFQLVTILDSLVFYQPHWPANQFGQVQPPPFYFAFFSFLLVAAAQKFPRLTTSLLVFIFLASFASTLVKDIPLGFAFRDSSKFFAPLALFYGLVIGALASRHKTLSVVIYFFVMLTLLPALSGRLTGGLSQRSVSKDLRDINTHLGSLPDFARSLWFTKRHPFAFFDSKRPALDADELVNDRVFADLNVGSYDRFNFLHSPLAIDWLKTLDIKYLILSGNPRRLYPDLDEIKNWDDLTRLLATNSALKKTDWGGEIPVYENLQVGPRTQIFPRLIAVAGGSSIYQFVSPSSTPVVFFEDGIFNPHSLTDIASQSAVLVLDHKSDLDLTMSYLQSYFTDAAHAVTSDWAVRSASDYLSWKYELLTHGLDLKDLDYHLGLAFSTVPDEVLGFSLPVPKTQIYVQAVRRLHAPDSHFTWEITPNLHLQKGRHQLVLKSRGGLDVLNVVALIPQDKWDEADRLTKRITGTFPVVADSARLPDFLKIPYPPSDFGWLVVVDRFDPLWKARLGGEYTPAVPVHSLINGFYVNAKKPEPEIIFTGQNYIVWGLYLSSISLLILLIIYLWQKEK